jgi:hypothetical protein
VTYTLRFSRSINEKFGSPFKPNEMPLKPSDRQEFMESKE